MFKKIKKSSKNKKENENKPSTQEETDEFYLQINNPLEYRNYLLLKEQTHFNKIIAITGSIIAFIMLFDFMIRFSKLEFLGNIPPSLKIPVVIFILIIFIFAIVLVLFVLIFIIGELFKFFKKWK